jgi:hypothetical protein
VAPAGRRPAAALRPLRSSLLTARRAGGAASVPHSRIDDGVQDVHDQIRNHDEERRQHDHAKDLREIVVLDREDRKQAETVQREGELGELGVGTVM